MLFKRKREFIALELSIIREVLLWKDGTTRVVHHLYSIVLQEEEIEK